MGNDFGPWSHLSWKASLILRFPSGVPFFPQMDGVSLFCALLRHWIELSENCPMVLTSTHFHNVMRQGFLPSSPLLQFQVGHGLMFKFKCWQPESIEIFLVRKDNKMSELRIKWENVSLVGMTWLVLVHFGGCKEGFLDTVLGSAMELRVFLFPQVISSFLHLSCLLFEQVNKDLPHE